MRGFVAPTDDGWYRFLRARPDLDEVNFWRPGAGSFVALEPGEPFFFKLKAPDDAIGGFGQFLRFVRLPLWQAWDTFGQANGVPDVAALRMRLGRLSSSRATLDLDRPIGCIVVASPTFFAPDRWVPPPADWKRNIVSGRSYDLRTGEGHRLWKACVERAGTAPASYEWTVEADDRLRYGAPRTIEPRLGQGTFRLAVLGAYGGACAVTGERTLPALEAAHIRPYSEGGAHEVRNGIPLRRDLHRLFDLGYVTVRPDRTLAVSRRLHEEFADGRAYYALEGRKIDVPDDADHHPDPQLLAWHGEAVFRS